MFKLLTYTNKRKDEAIEDRETEREKELQREERGRMEKSEQRTGAEVTVVGGCNV